MFVQGNDLHGEMDEIDTTKSRNLVSGFPMKASIENDLRWGIWQGKWQERLYVGLRIGESRVRKKQNRWAGILLEDCMV